jgi:dTDP-4-amino-4,6-dideoxygalactose transaminase
VTAAPVKVPLSDVRPDEEIRAAAAEAVAGGWWSMGPRVAQFERDFATLTGSPHVFAVANGTAALHLALLGADIRPGDEVIVPSLNFVAAANVVSLVGGIPVFCDIVSPSDLNLNPTDVEAAITPRTRAVIALHYAGFPCDMDALLPLASAAGATVIEDAAHAPGATIGGRACGTLGAIGCFSFFANKNLPVGEGGMVITGSDELADALRLLRSHGMTTLTWDRHRGHADTYDVLRSGLNYRLDEIRAAIGIVQLSRLEEENRRRGEIWRTYIEQFADVDGVSFPFVDRELDEKPSHHLAVAVLDHALDRRAFRAFLLERGVQTSVHYPPIHHFTAYKDAPRMRALPQTDDVAPRIVTLPLYGGMSDEQIATVVHAVRDAIHDQSPSSTASHGVVETPSRQA